MHHRAPHNGAVTTADQQTAYSSRRPPWTIALTLVTLIALPTALAMLGLTLLTTATPTGAERATPLMGQGVAQVTEVFDHAVIQTPDGSSTLTISAPATSIPGWPAQGTAAQRATALGEAHRRHGCSVRVGPLAHPYRRSRTRRRHLCHRPTADGDWPVNPG